MPSPNERELKYLLGYNAPAPDTNPDRISQELFPETEEAPSETREGWWPDLYDEQMEVFNDHHKYILLHSERFSGKTFCCCHKIVRHSWENWNALAMMVSFNISSATGGGFWEEIVEEVLPAWSHNIGLQWIGPRMDAVSKASYIKVGNYYKGWSTIMLKSIPHGSVIGTRFRNTSPSMIFFDELTQTNDERYFKDLVQQIGRRKYIKYQQFLGTCNPPPEGPDHWVYKRWFTEPEKDTAKKYWKDNYRAYHIPMAKNVKHEKLAEYKASLEDQCRDDPTAYQRLVEGKWVKQLSGLGIFKNYWRPRFHIRGDAAKGNRFVAQPGFPIVMGMDIGDVNQGVVFMQFMETKKMPVFLVLDELVTVGEKIAYENFVRMIMDKMNEVAQRSAIFHGIELGAASESFRFEQWADSSSENFDASAASGERENLERISRKEFSENKEMYPYLGAPLNMMPVSKGPGSVRLRIRLLIELLQTGRIFIDSGCKNVIEMFTFITAIKESPFQPARNSAYKHALDALTYPISIYMPNDHISKTDDIKPFVNV